MLKILIIALLVSFNCSSKFQRNKTITGVKVTQVFPNINNQGKLLNYDTVSVNIYSFEEYKLYHLVYRFDSIINKKLILSEDRFHYLIHHKDSSYGYDFDKNKIPVKRLVLMDSVFRIEWFTQINIDPIFSQNKVQLLETNKHTSTGMLSELYSLKGRVDTSMSGMCTLFFSDKLKDIGFTLSNKLDSIKGMKLYEIKIVNNPRKLPGTEILIDKIESSYKLEKAEISNSEIFRFIEMHGKMD